MDFSYPSFFIGVAVMMVIIAVVAYWGNDTDTSDTDDLEHSDPALRELYKIAAQLNAFFAVAAHPADLVKHDLFEKGAQKLIDGAFSEDDLLNYAKGENAMLACLAVEALKRNFDTSEMRQRLLGCFSSMAVPPYYVALDYIDAATPALESLIGPAIIESADHLWNDTVQGYLEKVVRNRVAAGETPTFGSHLARIDDNDVYDIEQFISSLTGIDTTGLKEELKNRSVDDADPALLKAIGKVWDARTLADTDGIIENDTLALLLDRLEMSLEAAPARSALVVGETGVGKSSAISRLAHRLNVKGWTIFMAGHAELISGQMYIGQFEERLNQLIEQLTSREHTLWFIPSFDALAFSGRHKYSPVSALDTILPYVESGEVKIIGEVSRAAYERLTLTDPRIASVFSINRIEPLPVSETINLGKAWLAKWTRKSDEKTLKEAWHLAQHFLSETAAPGNLLKLLKLTHQRLSRGKPKDAAINIAQDDLLATLVELTGLSEVMLNDEQPLDLEQLRTHFHQRVIGQDEAVTCLVERVAMIKAGVTDPTRPAGVFLFAGPTGTGKTEIAKALSEWLFGSPDRMIRLDMSELQTAESLGRLIGSDETNGGALTDMIHEQPFSIVLLDEFEKAHPTVWDLFLQVFDDGRLTDRQGRTADFRHAIVILTSNLGAAIPTDTPMGFGSAPSGFDPASVLSEVEKMFRREFINRIDRVVVFRPLSRDVMRDILQKELDLAFQRRGLRSRSWAVEWDEAAVDFLLDQGFTPDLGARPLKRAIDRHLLAPLAQTIVNRQVPAGDQFLFVTQKDRALAVEFVDPDAGDTMTELVDPSETGKHKPADAAGGPTLRSVMLNTQGTRAEFEYLFARIAGLQDRVASDTWRHDKETILSFLETPDFWQSPERFEVLGQVELIDRIEAALRRVGSLMRRIAGPAAKRENYPPQIISSAAQSLYLIETACEDLTLDRPREAFIMVETGRQSATQNVQAAAFADRLSNMYLNWAKKRRMQFSVLRSSSETTDTGFRFILAVAGFGAHTLLEGETGLHVLETPATGSDKAKRLNARVFVVPQPPEPVDTDVKARRRQAETAFLQFEFPGRKVVRRYREEPSPLVRDAIKGWRTGRCDRVLDGDFDLFE